MKDESRIPKYVLSQKKEIVTISEIEFKVEFVVEKGNVKGNPSKPAIFLE